jgi:pimeloyl-ACP methyl ester carboxylesterase
MIRSHKARAAFRLAALLASAPVLAQVLHAGPAYAQAAAFQPTRFSVEVRGQGPDVILLPGLGSSAQVWGDAATQLAGTHRVHVVQVAGFAGAPVGGNADGPVMQPIVDELHRYIQSRGLAAPTLVGHSLGGIMGLMLAADHPQDLGRLLVVDAFPYLPAAFNPAATPEQVTPQAAMLRQAMLGQSPEAARAAAEVTAARMVLKPQARKAVVDWTSASDRSVFARATYDGMTTDLRPRLAAIRIPVQVLYPHDASMGQPATAVDGVYQRAYAGLAGVKLKRIDGAYHFLMLDQPEAFEAELKAFLK